MRVYVVRIWPLRGRSRFVCWNITRVNLWLLCHVGFVQSTQRNCPQTAHCYSTTPHVTRHTSIRYSSSCHTRVNMGASIFFTAAMIRGLKSARSCKRFLCVLCTKCALHSNHRLTRVIFQHTKRLLPRSGHFLTTYTRIA